MARKLSVKAQVAAVRALLEEGVDLDDIAKRVDLSKGVEKVKSEQATETPSRAQGSGSMAPIMPDFARR